MAPWSPSTPGCTSTTDWYLYLYLGISRYLYLPVQVDLAWDSPLTWAAAAILIDLGYYWFHRASHEVALLWSVHQVSGGKYFYCL